MSQSTSTARARSRTETAPAEPDTAPEPGYRAILVHGKVYYAVGADGARDQVFHQGTPESVTEGMAHRLAAATDLVTRGHKDDDEGLYSVGRQKFLVTGPVGTPITPDDFEPPAKRDVERLAKGSAGKDAKAA